MELFGRKNHGRGKKKNFICRIESILLDGFLRSELSVISSSAVRIVGLRVGEGLLSRDRLQTNRVDLYVFSKDVTQDPIIIFVTLLKNHRSLLLRMFAPGDMYRQPH